MNAHPAYSELPAFEKTGERHAWEFFPEDDELGTLNFLTPETVRAAAAEVRTGQIVSLSTTLDAIDPPLAESRHPFRHVVTRDRAGSDDSLDGFYLQGASHWDGLQHVRYREFGYFGGRQEESLEAGELGIQVMAERGVIGRGVLIDVARHRRGSVDGYRPDRRMPIGVTDLEDVLSAQGTELRPGDVLLLRTGWVGWYLSLAGDERAALVGTLHSGEGGLESAGLDAGKDVAGWLWERRVSAIAVDNPAVEVLPVDAAVGFLHRRLVPLLGMPLGEFWALDALGEACARSGRWSFLLTSAPLPLVGGAGSPNNAYAIL